MLNKKNFETKGRRAIYCTIDNDDDGSLPVVVAKEKGKKCMKPFFS